MNHLNANIQDSLDLIWHNLPRKTSTHSMCKCNRARAKGGIACIYCSKEKLALLVGESVAQEYLQAVETISRLEKVMFK